MQMAGTDVGQFVRAVHPCAAQLCESDGTVFALLGSHEEASHVTLICFIGKTFKCVIVPRIYYRHRMPLSDAGTSRLLVLRPRLTSLQQCRNILLLIIPSLPIPLIQSPVSGSVTGCKFCHLFHFYLHLIAVSP